MEGDGAPVGLGRMVDLRPPGALLDLSSYYGGSELRIVDELLGQAYALGAQTALIEYHHSDEGIRRPGRSTSTSPSQIHTRHRIHFFVEPPTTELSEFESAQDLSDLTYLGFVDLNPEGVAKVDQAFLLPPPDLMMDVTCSTQFVVELFGYQLLVQAAPFMAIDPHVGGRVEASLWMCVRALSDQPQEPLSLEDVGRALPPGLGVGHSVTQIAEGSRALGLPALIYDRSSLPVNESISSIASRYLNSGIPVMAVTRDRAVLVMVGYRPANVGTVGAAPRFVCNDCEVGPYQLRDEIDGGEEGMWEHLVIPHPPDVLLTGEVAEELGKAWIRHVLESVHNAESPHPSEASRGYPDEEENITYCSTLVSGNQFKTCVRDRGASPLLEGLYRRMELPLWVWVVEVIRNGPPANGECRAVADVVIDATTNSQDLAFVAMRVPGRLWSSLPGTSHSAVRSIPEDDSLQSLIHHCSPSYGDL